MRICYLLKAFVLHPWEYVNKWLGLAFWFLITFFAAWFGSQFRPGEWYASLNQPTWTPPSQIFAPVWGVLYLLMAISAWLVWVKKGLPKAKYGLNLYLVQLTLNALWSWIFFGLHRPGLAAFEIILLWIAIAMTVVAFARVRPLAAILMLPYLLWVSYAASLNLGIWWMN